MATYIANVLLQHLRKVLAIYVKAVQTLYNFNILSTYVANTLTTVLCNFKIPLPYIANTKHGRCNGILTFYFII
jgi:hypothetical protein